MRNTIFIVLATSILGACGLKTGTYSAEETGYVQFTGNWSGASVQIDDAPRMAIGEMETTVQPILKYGLKPGKHQIKVTRGEQLLVNRVIFIGDSQTMEVRLP